MRSLPVAFALVELLVPRRIVDAAERLAFRNPGETSLRRWTLPLARLEGLAWIALVGREGRPSRPVRAALGAVGLPMLLAPDRTLAAALRLSYSDADRIEVRSWVRPAVRLVGVAYLLVAAGLLGRRSAD